MSKTILRHAVLASAFLFSSVLKAQDMSIFVQKMDMKLFANFGPAFAARGQSDNVTVMLFSVPKETPAVRVTLIGKRGADAFALSQIVTVNASSNGLALFYLSSPIAEYAIESVTVEELRPVNSKAFAQ